MRELSGLDRIRIDGFKLPVFIGVGAAERSVAQNIVIEIEAWVEMAGARHHDGIEHTLDYADIHAQILEVVQSRSFALLEHLGQALLEIIVAQSHVLQARVVMAKPGILHGATPHVSVNARRLTRVALGLGANIGRPHETLVATLDLLKRLGTCCAVSSLYRSEPWGVAHQPTFLNAAVILETTLMPQAILAGIKGIEQKLGRQPGPRWGPRVIDIDILDDFSNHTNEVDLIVPHPRLYERAFALMPLAEIAPEYESALYMLPAESRATVVPMMEWPRWAKAPA